MDVSDLKAVGKRARVRSRYDELAARIDLTAALRMAARMALNEGVCNHFSM